MKMLSRFALISCLLLLAVAANAQTDYATFQPVFNSQVYVINPQVPGYLTQPRTPVNPVYALSETSALDLQVLLAPYGATLFHSGPFGWLKSWGFGVTVAVPWFAFPDGSVENAGLIAAYFTHGFSPSYAELLVTAEMTGLQKLAADPANNYLWNVTRLP